MPAKEGLCQGGDGTCDCEVFFPQKDNAAHCLECLHGISKHCNTDGTLVATQPLPAISGSSNVGRIFEGLANKHPTGLSQVAQLDPHYKVLATKTSKLVQKVSSQRHTSSQKFHVGSITIITCGLDILTSQIKIKANGWLLKDPLPLPLADRKIFIQQLERSWMLPATN
ncbi:hypothetical protein F5J12DRAFT_787277 [Pisolithus orientalis]|uniref:uncharacterized protein n=1 Tax=Pisolithus orientalis TaxID=936130 RepID=UPI0022255E27|nr:uncharacterized protein F5J12DRAFT_787277 [Pisolithus orientalis]KAI5986083.1 hypothetical protein F5J12DRAFT_787277 [Pisolithus orientalis]